MALGLTLTLATPALAGSYYDESIYGDLQSDNTQPPTALSFSGGANQVIGTTYGPRTAPDRDFFTFTVPVGGNLSSILVVDAVGQGPGQQEFISINAGSAAPNPLPTNAASTKSALLGYWHFSASDDGTDILQEMGSTGRVSGVDPAGFIGSLPAGQYTIWIQDTAGDADHRSTYNLVFNIPEPATGVLALAGLSAIAAIRRRRR